MRYGSICSGIEAATVAWHPLGWKPAFFSEIEAAPRAVLAHHYPDVPLHGDFTTIEAGQYEPIDLLVGGTPCQDFSVAGLRAGLDGERGNLTLEFVRLLKRLQPQFFVWENVPGVLSLKEGDTFRQVLDAFCDAGYILDVDILDAQFHGVPQRRRRVFVCGQLASDILKVRTPSSALTILQCLAESLVLALTVLSGQSPTDSTSLAFDASDARHSLRRRMKLFGEASPAELASILERSLVALQASSDCGQGGSALGDGRSPTRISSENTESPGSTASRTGTTGASPNTVTSWNNILVAACSILSECTTSTAASETTGSKIFTCSQAMLGIAERITRSPRSSPCFWSAALSSLTGLEAFTDYARQAASDLFADLERVHAWSDFVREAEPTNDALGDIGIECFGEIFPLAESLSGNPPPRREAGQGTTHDVAPSLGASGRGFERAGETRGQDPVVAVAGAMPAAGGTERKHGHGWGQQEWESGYAIPVAFGGNDTRGPIDIATAVNAHGGPHGRQDFESETFVCAPPLTSNPYGDHESREGLLVTHALRAEGFDASEDGTGRGTPLVPVAYSIMPQNSGKDYKAREVDVLQPLMAGGPTGGNQGGDYIVQPVAFSSKDHGADAGEIAPTLRAMGHSGSHANAGGQVAVAFGSAGEPGYNSHHADAEKTRSVETLRALRDAVGEETFAEWGFGILAPFWPQEVLQCEVHGRRIRRSPQRERGLVNVALSRSQAGSAWTVQDLWEAGCEGCPPQGWQPSEQLARELGAYLSQLPQSPSPAQRFLHAMWEASEGSRLLREALSAIQAARRSALGKDQPAHSGSAVRRLTVEECEALQGFPRSYTAVPYRGKQMADGPRYKMLGNSMAVPVMHWIGDRIDMVRALVAEMERAA